jgi:drug/metabolite transporter (DMT)-like permease
LKPSPVRLYGLIGLMTLFWSLNYVAAKFALRDFPPLLAGVLRTWMATALIVPVYLWIGRRDERAHRVWEPREMIRLALLGVFGVSLNQLCFITGMKSTSVSHAALVIALTPVCVLLIAWMRGQERLSAWKLAGMVLAMCGVAVLNFGPGKDAHGASLAGDLTVFGASLSFALYSVFGKETSLRHSSLTMNSFGFLAGAIALIPVFFWQTRGFDYSHVGAPSWSAVVYMAVFPSVVCYLIYSYALSHISASRVSAFSYSQPLIASLAGVAVLGESITGAVLAGGVLVLCGVWLTSRS